METNADGYSHLITFIAAARKNMSNTILVEFVKATVKYGVPFHIRTEAEKTIIQGS